MSLQVWLPLKGDLENLGLDEITINDSGLIFDDNGKIGKALSMYGVPQKSFTVPSLVNAQIFSFSFWYKPIEDSSLTTNWRNIVYFGDVNTEGTSGTLRVQSSYGTGKDNYTISIHNNSAYSIAPAGITYTKTWNDWCHVAFTCDGKTCNYYTNGELIKSESCNGGKLTGIAYLGSGGNNNPNGLLNDFRIYDHCLSAKEVKLISQALVCHYPLDDQFIEATTNLRTWQLPSSGTWDEIWGGSTTVWSVYDTTNEPVPFDRCYKGEITYSGSSGGASRYIQTLDILPSTTYTYSAYIKASDDLAHTHANFLYRYEYPGDASNTGTKLYEGGVFNKANMQACGNGWYRCWGTFTTLAGTNSMRIAFFTYPNKNATYYVGGWMLEQKDHVTPYIFGSRNGDETVYDCSGYGNNGTMSDTVPTASDGSPRYLSCMEFVGTNNYIEFQNLDVMPAILPKEWSIAFWVYNDDAGNRSVYFSNYSLGGVGGNSFGLEKSTAERFRIYCMNGSFDLHVPAANLTITGNEWIHLCVTKNSDDLMTIYKNGSSVYTYTNNYCLSTGKVYRIGADSRSTSDVSFKGKMSDFRIYATALSADDVKELYETSASVDNHGNMYAYEFNEE